MASVSRQQHTTHQNYLSVAGGLLLVFGLMEVIDPELLHMLFVRFIADAPLLHTFFGASLVALAAYERDQEFHHDLSYLVTAVGLVLGISSLMVHFGTTSDLSFFSAPGDLFGGVLYLSIGILGCMVICDMHDLSRVAVRPIGKRTQRSVAKPRTAARPRKAQPKAARRPKKR